MPGVTHRQARFGARVLNVFARVAIKYQKAWCQIVRTRTRLGFSMMHKTRIVALTLLLSIGLDAPARETVLDKVIHVQDIVLDVPEVARLDAGLDLDTKRIDVGGASLHVEEEGTGVPLVLINGGRAAHTTTFTPGFHVLPSMRGSSITTNAALACPILNPAQKVTVWNRR